MAGAAGGVLTVPNALSVLRLVLVPVFLYLLLVAHATGWAVGVLMFSGFSDWADGRREDSPTSTTHNLQPPDQTIPPRSRSVPAGGNSSCSRMPADSPVSSPRSSMRKRL